MFTTKLQNWNFDLIRIRFEVNIMHSCGLNNNGSIDNIYKV